MASEMRVVLRAPSSRERPVRGTYVGLASAAGLALLATSCQGSLPAFTGGVGQLPPVGRVQGNVGERGVPPSVAVDASQIRTPTPLSEVHEAGSLSSVAWLAAGAVAGLALSLSNRSLSAVTMNGKHDRRTFHGKLKGHTFGKYRFRKTKARRLKAIRNGTFKAEEVVQRGQPEPDHCWDDWVMVDNLWYTGNMPQWYKDMWLEWFNGMKTIRREEWKTRMGKYGKQIWYKNWTPPGQEAPPELDDPDEPKGPPPAPAPEPEPKDPEPPAEEPPAAPEAAKEEPPTEPEPPAPEEKEEEPPAKEEPPAPAPEPEAKEEPPAPAPEPEAKEEPPAPAPEPEAKEEPPAPAPEPEAKEEPPAPAPEPEAKEEPPAPAPEPEAKEEPPAPAPEPEAKEEPPAPAPEPEAKEEPPAPAPEPEAKEEPPAPAPEPEAKEEAKAPEPEPVKEEKTEEKAAEPKAEAKEAAPAPEEKKPEVAAAVVSTKISAADVKELRERSRAGILDCKKALAETDGDMDKAMDWLRKKGIAKADKKAGNVAVEGNIASYVHFNKKLAVLVEVNSETDFVASNAIFKEFANDIAMQIAANPTVTCVTSDDVPEEVKQKEKELEMQKEDLADKPDNIKEKMVTGRLKKKFDEMALVNQKWLKDEDKTVDEVIKERIAKLGENIVVRRFVRLNLGEGLEKKDTDFAAGVEKELAKYRTGSEGAAKEEKPAEEEKPKEEKPVEEKPKEEAKPAVAVSAAQVKELRQRSGAGIMDSKKALAASDGDMDKAMEWLKKKGMAKADKKAGNVSAEGAIASYVHFNSKLGVIVEVNSETDFVAMNAIFKEFSEDVAMQIAANPAIVSISADDVPPDVIAKEKEIEMNREDLEGKPDNIKEKIVTGRLKKKYEEVSLMSQKWLKDEEKTVEDVLKERIAKLGENIVIRRFERLVLGEGLEKKEDDFAAGVEKELAKYRS